jgi:hypothetical protein
VPPGVELAERLLSAFSSADAEAEAAERLARTRALGFVSDWEGSPKEGDFARLVSAAARSLPAGSSAETGLFRGGTSSLMILADAPGGFHVSVDPFGLPTQSLPNPEYREWPAVRATLRGLHELAEGSGVTYCHYLTDSLSFIRGDLLAHPARFAMVHLDGDHAYEVVHAELEYFMAKLPGPTLFLLDDHDDHFPGVERALQRFRDELTPVMHRLYDFPGYGEAGFSAWLRVR